MALRAADASDWHAMTGTVEPEAWFGLVETNQWMIEGMGAIYRSLDGRWWVMFVRAPGVRKVKTAHASAKKLFQMASEQNIAVHALADSKISGAEKWIARFGFKKTGEELEGYPVWALK